MYQNEINKIKSQIDPDVYSLFQESGAVLAGGAVTSLFTSREINDWDIYFKTKSGFCNVIREMYGYNKDSYTSGIGSMRITHFTKRSILTDVSGENVQLIGFKNFETVENIFKSFDFTINMGAFDFATESMILHEDFMKHNSQRFLSFNERTDFPLISALRVDKYRERGYSISKAQMFRILLAVNSKNFESWEDIKNELGGLYGLNPDEIFDETKPFDINEASKQLDKVFLPNKHYQLKNCPYFQEVMDNFEHMIDEETMNWYNQMKSSGNEYSWKAFENFFV